MQAAAASQTLAVRRLGLVDYQQAWDLQGELVGQRQQGLIPDTLLLLQHPHTYTFGRRGTPDHLLLDEAALRERGLATYWVDRGGDVTYHGPGQIVGYPIIDLRANHLDVHQYLRTLEAALIGTLARFDIAATRDPAYTGVWTRAQTRHCEEPDPVDPPTEPFLAEAGPHTVNGQAEAIRGGGATPAKIAAIGVKVSRGVTSHGFALNVNTDLSYFEGIIPCGITDRSVTSMQALLGREVAIDEVEDQLASTFWAVLG